MAGKKHAVVDEISEGTTDPSGSPSTDPAVPSGITAEPDVGGDVAAYVSGRSSEVQVNPRPVAVDSGDWLTGWTVQAGPPPDGQVVEMARPPQPGPVDPDYEAPEMPSDQLVGDPTVKADELEGPYPQTDLGPNREAEIGHGHVLGDGSDPVTGGPRDPEATWPTDPAEATEAEADEESVTDDNEAVLADA